MPGSKYLYAKDQKKYFLKLEGDLTYIACAGFKSFTDKILDERLVEELYVDLSGAKTIDSTNLGILAKCALYFMSKKSNKAVIYSNKQDINTILNKNGFDSIFDIVGSTQYSTNEMSELTLKKFENREGLNNTLLDAHEVLSKINNSNRLKYRDVLEMLRFKRPSKNN